MGPVRAKFVAENAEFRIRIKARTDPRADHKTGLVEMVPVELLQAILRARREELSMVPVPLHGTKADDRERSAFQVFDWQHELMKLARSAMDGADGFAFKEWRNSSRDLADACDALGIPVVSLHGLRHVFAGWALDDGIEMSEVAKALGHADLRQLMRTYDNRDPHVMQRRAEEQAAARQQVRLVALPGGKASGSG